MRDSLFIIPHFQPLSTPFFDFLHNFFDLFLGRVHMDALTWFLYSIKFNPLSIPYSSPMSPYTLQCKGIPMATLSSILSHFLITSIPLFSDFSSQCSQFLFILFSLPVSAYSFPYQICYFYENLSPSLLILANFYV